MPEGLMYAVRHLYIYSQQRAGVLRAVATGINVGNVSVHRTGRRCLRVGNVRRERECTRRSALVER